MFGRYSAEVGTYITVLKEQLTLTVLWSIHHVIGDYENIW